MINKKLRTSNTMLKKINEQFPVMEAFSTKQAKNKFIIYENVDCGWDNVTLDKMHYICDVDIDPANKKTVMWRGKEYTDVEVLMTEVFAYNDTRDFPAWTYDPQFAANYNNGSKIWWYLTKKLNFKDDKNDCYYIGNFDDSPLKCFVEISWNDSSPIAVSYKIFGQTFYQSFDDVKELCESVSSMLTLAVSDHVATTFELTRNFPDDIVCGKLDNIKEFNMNNFEVKSAKDKLVAHLENILSRLKSE